ncbi:N-6 DNA methylase [Flavobacterium sp. WC2421]|uniref:N-6 DNA methylase n=1 Tax=Flavobacterium sp. WC2421 TaxID=3234138 RepID=UPI003466DDF1
MSESKNSWNSDFWNLLNKLRGKIEVDSLKNYILTLVFLRHISDNKNTNTGLNITIPADCDFQSILKLCYEERTSIGNEINKRLNSIARENPIFDGVINFIDFNSASVLGKDHDSDIILGNIILLIEDYSNRHASSDNTRNTIWVDTFEHVNQSFIENSVKYSAGTATPNEIGILIAKLIGFKKDNSVKSIYDPVCGTGSLLFSVFKEGGDDVTIYGETRIPENIFVAKLTFLFHGITDYNLENRDVLNFPSFLDVSMDKSNHIQTQLKKFDYVVSNPPFNVHNWSTDPHSDMFDRWNSTTGIPPTNSGDFAFLLHIVKSLKENGVAACVVSNGVLFRGGSERNIRKYLLESGFIKGIIGLPAKLLYGTGIPSSIIILENKPDFKRDSIFIIDASKEYLSERFINKLMPENINHIADVWENGKEENEFSRIVPYSEIAENDFNFNLPRYLTTIDDFEVPEGSTLVELSNVLTSVPRVRTDNESGKLVKISDLLNDSFLYTIAIDSLAEDIVSRVFNKLTAPALLISKRFNKLKPSFIDASLDYPVFISPDIDAFTINNDIVDLSYLIQQLSSDYVTKQVDSFSLGTVMPNLRKQDFMRIKVVIPRFDTQGSLILQRALTEGARIQSDKGKIETFQLQATIDTLLKERMNDFQWKLHDIRNGELLNLKGQIVTLEMFADANPELFNNIVDQDSNDTVHSSIKDIYTSVQKLAVILSDLYDTSENASIKENIDVLVFIKEFCDNQLKSNGNLFEIDCTDIDKIKIDFDIKELIISVYKKDLQRVFTNIFDNAIKHGGFKGSNQVNKIKMALSLDSKEEMVTIAVLNNGKPSKINAMDYFADGGKAGSTSNSGKGGHIVKVLTERNNGKVFQNNYAIDEANGYTFEVGVEFKYKLSYEL